MELPIQCPDPECERQLDEEAIKAATRSDHNLFEKYVDFTIKSFGNKTEYTMPCPGRDCENILDYSTA